MRYWVREIVGWCLMLLGLLFFAWTVVFVNSRQVVEAAILASIGAIVFRSGIHLMKVAVAAQAYAQTHREATAQVPLPAQRDHRWPG